MFIFSDFSLCRMQQPAWSSGLLATTTSHRLLLIYTGFQYVSKLSTRRRCLCGSVYMMQPLAIGLTCVCRPIPCMVASNYVPRRLGLCWSCAPGLLPVSAASPSVLLQASSQGPPVSAVVYAAAGRWAQPAPLWLLSEFGSDYKYSDLLAYCCCTFCVCVLTC